MRIEESTIVDKKIYEFVRGMKEKIDGFLIEKLIEKGASKKDIKIEYEPIPSTCCPKKKVIVYAEVKRTIPKDDVED